jgi:hypothetical protein
LTICPLGNLAIAPLSNLMMPDALLASHLKNDLGYKSNYFKFRVDYLPVWVVENSKTASHFKLFSIQ